MQQTDALMLHCHRMTTGKQKPYQIGRDRTVNYCFEENRWGERFIPELNRDRHERRSASAEYADSLDFNPEAENQLTLIIGSDSGLLFRHLRSLTVPESSRIVLIEPADILAAIHEEYPDHASRERVMLLGADQWQAALFDSSDTPWFMAGKVELIQSGCAISDYQNCYYPLFREVREAISNRRHALFTSYRHRIFIDEQMANCIDSRLPLLRDPDFGHGHVALVMGGGPSLDDHLDWIIENRSKLFIIAVSRLCSKLDDLQLRPDMVIAMDPSPLTHAAAKRGTQWNDVPLVHSYHVAHMLPKQWLGPRYFVGARFPWESLRPVNTEIIENAGPTVGHAATVVAAQLGFSTILLSGVDLCMNLQGDSHTRGTPEAELLKLPGNYDAQVETYAGNQAGTSIDFFRSIESLSAIGQNVNRDGTRLFNLNPHAAAIRSIPHISCQQVELETERPSFDNAAHSEPDLAELETLRRELSRCKKDFDKIRTLCSKALRCVDLIYGKAGKPPNPGYHQRLDALEARLEKASPALLGAIRYLMATEFAALRKPSGFTGMDQQAMEDWAREYYEITDSGARHYQRALVDAMELLTLRQDELSPTPDIAHLLQAWQQQETPGRIMKFHDTLLATANDAERERIEQARSAYLQSLQTREAAHEERVVSNYGTIRKTMQSLRYLRNKGCVSDLQRYSEKLQDLEWPHATIAHFILASIADMSGDHETALPLFQQVIDECAERLNSGEESLESVGSLIEETLTCLTRIYLDQQQGEAAASTLGMLSEITPQYVPSYANLLDMLGNHESAVELLEMYLKHYPGNWRAARQLAQMHDKAGNVEACRKAEQLAESIRDTALQTKKVA